tara:strand:- start:15452 stop:22636 length:7185 start_codon:yes stop_codon:yes gene_type:complete
MALFNKGFRLGKMNKDMDERVVPSGEYRDALNLQVQTSDGSNMGSAQTLMGNVLMSQDLVPPGSTCVGSIADNKNDKIYYLVAGPEPLGQDWETSSAWKDYIIEYDIKTETFKYVFVDIYRTNFEVKSILSITTNPQVSGIIELYSVTGNPFTHIRQDMLVDAFDASGLNYIAQHVKGATTALPGVIDDKVRLFSTRTDFVTTAITAGTWLNFSAKRVLDFHKDRYITGINIVDGMLFWTDNYSEPKKINIKRSIAGTGGFTNLPVLMPGTFNGDSDVFHTRLCITPDKSNPLTVKLRSPISPYYAEEENITVIKKHPLSAPILKMSKHDDKRVDTNGIIVPTFSSTDGSPSDISGPPAASQNSFSYTAANGFDYLKRVGDQLSNVYVVDSVLWLQGDTIILNQNQEDDVSVEDFTEHDVRCTVVSSPSDGTGNGSTGPFVFDIESIDKEAIDAEQKIWHLRLEEKKPMFEFKIPRFAYRYKYEDGEYSTFSPWSQPAFLPGSFDYLPKKAFNLGMTNRLRSLRITNYVAEESLRPQDVVEIDLLYKEESSPNVYTVETIKITDGRNTDDLLLWPDAVFWNGVVDGGGVLLVDPALHHRGDYRVTSELIHATVPSNQTLRQWDNVPRKALAQEVTSNRLVYGNYLQNYNLVSEYADLEIKPKIIVSISSSVSALGATTLEEDPNLEDGFTVEINTDTDGEFETLGSPTPHRTCRSLREYQIGVVYGDEYGRETPVLAGDGATGSIIIPKERSSTVNKLRVQLANNPPDWAKYYKFFVKETSNEYYNLAMDRWYNAEDGNIWLSFASADRNKVDEETFIILKKRHDSHQPVNDPARYKIIAIENSAPDFIKTNIKDLGQVYNEGPNNNSIGTTTLGFPLVDYSEVWVADNSLGLQEVFGQAGATGNTSTGNTSSNHIGTIYDKIAAGTFFARIRTSNIKSDYYQVTKMVMEGGRYKFTIDGTFKEDVEFASADGTYSGRINDLRVQFSNHQVENKKEFEGRFFIKIFKDLVLLQNLLTPAEKKYKVTNVSKMGYWNMPRGGRASESSTGDDVNWESFAVNCKAELNADDYSFGVLQVRNGGFGITDFIVPGASASDKTMFFYTAQSGRKSGRAHNVTNKAAAQGVERWMDSSSYFFHVCATWVRATKAANFAVGTRDNEGGVRGRGVYNGGLSMDISYNHGGDNEYNWPNSSHPEHEEFYKQITTTGTTFRFREDPDEIIYHITSSDKNQTGTQIGLMHNYHKTTVGQNSNQRRRFRISFEQVDNPGVGLGGGPSGYNIVGGNPKTKVTGVKELGWWAGRYGPSQGWDLLGGGDDGYGGRAMVVPLPPGYAADKAKCPTGGGTHTSVTYPSENVTAIKQARRWRQHPNKYHHIEIVEVIDDGEDFTSTNPAIWETEPKEDVGMDIYYEASNALPVDLNFKTNELFAPFGSIVDRDYSPHFTPTNGIKVLSWSENTVTLYNPDDVTFAGVSITSGDRIRFTRPDGAVATGICNAGIVGGVAVPYPGVAPNQLRIGIRGWREQALPLASLNFNNPLHNQPYTLSWFNAYEFGNGVESNRIRDDYNQSVIRNGVKASTVLAEQYKEDHRKTGLIHSGIYNSTSGINRLNQFIAAEKITKDMNPSYGSIQKLHTRDSNIVVLHEDKCMKVLADKDALFNADGKKNVAISANFLGSDSPFSTRYGISTNPESCATDLAGRLYFADRTRGAVLRLSNDGITNIANYGMKDWFGDNLGPLTNKILGSFDEKKEEYNITIKGLYPVGSGDSGNGGNGGNGEDGGCGCEEGDGDIKKTANDGDEGNFENTVIMRTAGNLGLGDISVGKANFYNSEVTLSFSEKAKGWISFKSFVPESGVSINNEYYTFKDGEMYKHHANQTRNTFYQSFLGQAAYTESSVTLLFNDEPSTVKSFSTLNYEGSQARINQNLTDAEYYNLNDISGWYVSNIETNLQSTRYLEFKGKEDKWFTFIKGDTTTLLNLDENEFSVQGIGSFATMTQTGEDSDEVSQDRCLTINPVIDCGTPQISGCTDPTAGNYNSSANNDDGSCIYDTYGCTDATASNYDSLANVDDGSCTYLNGCTDSLATNYNALASVDDGSCEYCWPCAHANADTTRPGCCDPTQFNYDPTATCNVGSCVPFTYGCMTVGATNYNSTVNVTDNSCIWLGCTDPLASNYDFVGSSPSVDGINGQLSYLTGFATDDGTCTYPSIEGCMDSSSAFYNPLATVDGGGVYGSGGTCCDLNTCWAGKNVIGPIPALTTPIDLDLWSGSGGPITPHYDITTNAGNVWHHQLHANYPCALNRVVFWQLMIRHQYETNYPPNQLAALEAYMVANGGTYMPGIYPKTLGPQLSTWDKAVAAINSLGIYSTVMVSSDNFTTLQSQHQSEGYFQKVINYPSTQQMNPC